MSYLLVTMISGIAAFGTWFLTCPILIRLGLFLVGIVISAELFRQRGRLCGRAFAATLFSPSGSPTRLSDTTDAETDYVICATDLHACEHVYFSGNFVCSYRFGWGRKMTTVGASSGIWSRWHLRIPRQILPPLDTC
jgi:hypothetical protein